MPKPKLSVENLRRQLARVEEANEEADILSRPMSLSPAQIVPNPHNSAAAHDDEESIRQLADSIATAGLIHPLTVHKISDTQYMLLSGERRYKAITEHLHWDAIPCTVYQSLDPDMVTLVTVQANMEAREYTVADRLELYSQLDAALRRLKEKGKYKGGIGRGIAKMLGVSEQQIGKYKRLTNALSPDELAEVTNINRAIQSLSPKQKTETGFHFSEDNAPVPPLPEGAKTETEFQFLEDNTPAPPLPKEEKTETGFQFSENNTPAHPLPEGVKTETGFQFSEDNAPVQPLPKEEKNETGFQFSAGSTYTEPTQEDRYFAVCYKLRIARDAICDAVSNAEAANAPESLLDELNSIYGALVDVLEKLKREDV